MKQGGVSWSQSFHHKKGIQTRFRCKYCSREYKQAWTKEIHEKLCGEKTKNEKSMEM